ncbi:MAG TPA: hypothetical protein VHK47_16165 [Polyangia bacterium]|jgi:hypothetical protein|nr:hypothetical protein [Polyangia bacterium]
MHRELLWSNIVESSGHARPSVSWKTLFFVSLFGALMFCKYAHGHAAPQVCAPAGAVALHQTP